MLDVLSLPSRQNIVRWTRLPFATGHLVSVFRIFINENSVVTKYAKIVLDKAMYYLKETWWVSMPISLLTMCRSHLYSTDSMCTYDAATGILVM